MIMEDEIKQLERDFSLDFSKAVTAEAIEELRVKYLGRKAKLTQLFVIIPSLSPEEKARWGKTLNIVKQKMTAAIEDRIRESEGQEEKIDLTFPPASLRKGTTHIISSLMRDICLSFEKIGFSITEGHEIEDEWHNFTALNFPQNHPSRDEFDTFYLDIPPQDGGRFLLRCHTSPSQIRVMQQNKPPMAVVSPGRVYRPDEIDATHSFMFHQIEGFAVGTDINFSHLKGVLLYFAREVFSSDIQLRFRPHFFPFTEPSAEVDMSCIICGGDEKKLKNGKEGIGNIDYTRKQKCSVCKGKGWLEILGCGMIHPQVLSACGIDPEIYKGFAFGMGVERMAMLKYGINDIRLFTENDVRFLRQF